MDKQHSSQSPQLFSAEERPEQAGSSLLAIHLSETAHQVNTQAPPKVDVKHLNFFYGPKQALFDVTLPLFEQQVTAFIGPSGCGKSTFLRTLNRLDLFVAQTHLEGEAWVNEQNIYAPETDIIELR